MRQTRRLLAQYFLLLSLAVVAGGCWADAATQHAGGANTGRDSHTRLLSNERNTVKIAKRYQKSVVAINVTVRGERVNPRQGMPPQMRQFFRQFEGQGGPQQRTTERAAGSGFVVDPQGRILTNYHVIAHALKGESTQISQSADIKVRFSGGQPLPVKVVGVDQSYDLALLRLKNTDRLPAGAKPIPLADSDQIRVGEKAIAIGNPFLLQSTVTQGIVSAVDREHAAKVSGVPISYIQTDAAINPGNSGGPLLNSQGQAIGVNDEILAPNGTFVGVGFSIPSNLVRDNLSRLEAGGFIKKAMIGVMVEALQDYPKAVRQELNLPDYGVMVVKVKPHGPGARAGLQDAQFTINAQGRQWPAGGDILLQADGQKLTSGPVLQKIVFSKSAGAEVSLLVWRHGEKKRMTVTLAVLKAPPRQKAQNG